MQTNNLSNLDLVEELELDLTPLTIKILEEYHIPLLDVLLCFVFQNLPSGELSALAQAHLLKLGTVEQRLV